MPLVLVKSDPRAREKPCLRCGYSLRKILDARNCPECGLSVWVSLNQNDSLDWSRPEWLRQIALGAFIMAAAQVLGILMAVLIAAQEIYGWFVSAWVVAVYLLALSTGMILLSMPERRYPDKWKGYRWFVLVAAIVGGLIGLMMAGYSAFGRSLLDHWFWLFYVVQIVILVGAGATLLYLRKLAHRLGSHKLAKVLGWLLLIPLLKFAQAFPFWGISLAYGFCGLAEFLPWLYIPISLPILIYLALGFRKAATLAEVNWASAG
jgi:general stress protein CsbA